MNLETTAAANSFYSKGLNYLQIPDYRSALSNFLKAQSDPSIDIRIDSRIESARIYTMYSQFDSAFIFLNNALKLNASKKVKDAATEGIILLELGKAHADMSDVETSGDYYRKAISLLQESLNDNDLQLALAYSFYAAYFSFHRDYSSEIYWSKRAVKILETHKNVHPRIYCGIMLNHATAVKEWEQWPPTLFSGNFPKIRLIYLDCIRAARAYYKRSSIEEARALQGLANTYNDCVIPLRYKKSRWQEWNWHMADSLYNETIAIKRRILGNYNVSLATSKYTQALIYWSAGEKTYLSALDKFNEAMQVLDSAFHPQSGLSYPEAANTNFPYLMSVLLSNKGYVLDDLYKLTGDISYLIAHHEHNYQRLILWDKILSKFSSRTIGDVINLWNNSFFEESINTLHQLYLETHNVKYIEEAFVFAEKSKNNDYIQSLIKKKILEEGVFEKSNIYLSIDLLQSKLLDSQAYLAYVEPPATNFKSFCLAITKSTIHLIPMPNGTITDAVTKEYYSSIFAGNSKQYAQVSSQLYEMLVAPVIKTLPKGINNLIVSPAGNICRLPFESFTIKNNSTDDFRKLDYVLHHYKVSYALNAAMAYREVTPTGKHNLSVYVPSFDTLPGLLFSERQARALRDYYDGSYFIAKESTLKNFKSFSGNCSILQLSTHCIAPDSLDTEGRLLLSDCSIGLSYLLGDKLPVDLCIIPACKSGNGKLEYGEGTRSFSRACSYAGARATISSLWDVDDKSTADLIDKFYKNLRNNSMAPTALVQAKVAYISDCKTSIEANPFYWAGMYYSGDPKLQLSLTEHESAISFFIWLNMAAWIFAFSYVLLSPFLSGKEKIIN